MYDEENKKVTYSPRTKVATGYVFLKKGYPSPATAAQKREREREKWSSLRIPVFHSYPRAGQPPIEWCNKTLMPVTECAANKAPAGMPISSSSTRMKLMEATSATPQADVVQTSLELKPSPTLGPCPANPRAVLAVASAHLGGWLVPCILADQTMSPEPA